MSRSLSGGAILNFICKGEIPPPNKSTFQVIATKKIDSQSESDEYRKFRVCLSDGNHRFSQAVLLVYDEQNGDGAPPVNSIITIASNDSKNSLKTINGKLIFVIGSFKVIEKDVGSKIGNPIPVPQSAYQFPIEDDSNGSNSEPGTPSNLNSTSKNPPTLAYKRPNSEGPNSKDFEGNKAKMARRNLFPSKTTHCIKDLNPFQNKYVIQGRVVDKSSVKFWSNSRGEGKNFSAFSDFM